MPPESGFLLGVDGFPLLTEFLIRLPNCRRRCAHWVCLEPFAIDAVSLSPYFLLFLTLKPLRIFFFCRCGLLSPRRRIVASGFVAQVAGTLRRLPSRLLDLRCRFSWNFCRNVVL
nr:hypothetical protein Iba_chr02bCG13210 [Ipomoea batatas]GME19440.1 hypothetical protein Iba_scaffold22886CG0010 [Ipomoea batatas]